jgi:hypothetical protein
LKDHYRLFLNRIEEQLSTVGGGGEVNLKYLDDIVGVATNAAAYDGKFLRYNHSIGKFEFVTNSGYWVDTFESNVRVGIHTLTNVAINTSIVSRSDTGDLGLNPLTIAGSEVHGVGVHTCNKLVFTNEGDLGIGTDNPTHFNIWNTLTLDGNKQSSNGTIGGGDLVIKTAGKTYLDMFAFKTSPNSTGVGYTESLVAIVNRPFEIIGSGNSSVGYASTIAIEYMNVGLGTLNPRKSSQKQNHGLDVYNSDLYVGIGNTRGVVLTSPNGTAFRISVDNSGNLTTAQI